MKRRVANRVSGFKICALVHTKTHELKLAVPNSFMQWSPSIRVHLVYVEALSKKIASKPHISVSCSLVHLVYAEALSKCITR